LILNLKKKELMAHVAHQCIVMQFIIELSKTMKQDPRACVKPFFEKIQLNNKDYMAAFNDELEAFKTRIRNRAAEKIEEAMKEAEEEERQKRLGPGGLDPVEVFESLPESLQKCFESQNIELLQETLIQMDKKDAEYHLNRCIKSGLWVPNANEKKQEEEEEEGEKEEGKGDSATTESEYSKIEETKSQ
jgi:cell division cycle protein 37